MDIVDSCATKTLRHAKYVAIICLSLQGENSLGGNHSQGKQFQGIPYLRTHGPSYALLRAFWLNCGRDYEDVSLGLLSHLKHLVV